MFGNPSHLFLVSRSEFIHANRNWRDGHNLNVLAAPDIVCNQNQYQLCFQKPVLRTEGFVSESECSVISAQKLVGERRLRRRAWMAEDAAKSRLRTLNVRASDRNYSYESMMKSGQYDISGKIVEPTDAVATRSDSSQAWYGEARVKVRPKCFSRGPDMIVSARSEIHSFTADELSDDFIQETDLDQHLKLWPTKSFGSSSSVTSLLLLESEAITLSDDDEYSNDDEWGEDEDFSDYWN